MFKFLIILIVATLLAIFLPEAIAQTNTSPNMSMPVPIPGITPGVDWANDIVSSLTIIDSHNHSPGQGVQIMPNGLNINSDLTFTNNNAIHLRTTRFQAVSSPITNTGVDVGEVYVSGNELYYNDVSGGNQVQLTLNGSVNGTPGSISGLPSGTASASYAAGTFTWQSATNTAANMSFRNAILHNAAANSNSLTLQPPAAMGSNIVETLPTIPAALSFMTMDSSGNMITNINVAGGITGNMVAIGTLSNNLFSIGAKIPEVIQSIGGGASSYAALSTDGFIVINSTSMANITLYSAASGAGLPIKIYKNTGNFAAVTISSGSFSTTVSTLGEVVQLDNDGTSWYTISRNFNSQPMTYTPTLSNVGTGAGNNNFLSWREGHYLNIQGTFAMGTSTPNAIPTFSIGWGGANVPSGMVIDPIINSVSFPNSYIGTWGSQNTNQAAGCLFVIGGVTNSVSFGSFGVGNKCTNGVNASGIGDSTNVEFVARIPIQGWNN